MNKFIVTLILLTSCGNDYTTIETNGVTIDCEKMQEDTGTKQGVCKEDKDNG